MIWSGFRSNITRILVRQRYQWIPVRMRFCGSSDAPWSEWYDRGPGIGDPESWSGLITPWHQMQSIHLSKNTDTYLLVPVCKFHWQVTSALLLAFASSWWKLTQDPRALRVHENYSGFHLSGQAQLPRKCSFCFLDVKPLKIEPVGNIPCKQTSGGPVSVPL